MLYKFKSKVTGDVIMLEPNGRHVLQIIGKDTEGKGIVLPQQMPAALLALEQAIAQEEAAAKAARELAIERGEDPPTAQGVSLRQRALPFMDMLRRCHQSDEAVVWGV